MKITNTVELQNAVDEIYGYCRSIGIGEEEAEAFVLARLALLYAQERAQSMTKKIAQEAGDATASEKAI